MYCSSITYISHALSAPSAHGIGPALLRRTWFHMEAINIPFCVSRSMLVSSLITDYGFP